MRNLITVTITKQYLTGWLEGMTVKDEFRADAMHKDDYLRLVGKERKSAITSARYIVKDVQFS